MRDDDEISTFRFVMQWILLVLVAIIGMLPRLLLFGFIVLVTFYMLEVWFDAF